MSTMSIFYANIDQAVSDKAVTKPLSQVSIKNRFSPVSWGPRYYETTDQNVPHLELFFPPVYQPAPAAVPRQIVSNQATANSPEESPVMPILLRNHWETYNVNQGKVYGGFDRFSVNNIPSVDERSGDYMNFMDFTKPWSRVYVNEGAKDDHWAWDSRHGDYADTINRRLEAREMGVRL